MHVKLLPSLCVGGDLEIVNAARKSFGVGYDEFRTRADGPRSPRGRSDEELLADLIRDGHWLPFRHPQLSFECSAPMPVARQLGKHQVGMNWSEVSRRYKTKDITFYSLDGTWREDVQDRRQTKGPRMRDNAQALLSNLQAENIRRCIAEYESALRLGAAPEQARFLLPQSMEVSWTWTGSYLAWIHLWRQRTHPDTQHETRLFVLEAAPLIAERFPYSWPIIRWGQP